jgi:hypothetical protein
MSNSGRVSKKLHAILSVVILIFTVVLVNCRGESKMSHDPDLSINFTNLPYQSRSISELRIYKTSEKSFLSAQELSELVPVKIFASAGEVEEFFATMAIGRISSQDLAYKNLIYTPTYYHIIGLNGAKNGYGYLRVKLSRSKNLPLVAQVQSLSDTNSIQMMTGLAKLLVSMEDSTEEQMKTK